MAALYNSGLKPLQSGVYTNPYDHAARLFLDDNYRLAPKQSFLYYVVINPTPIQNTSSSSLLNFVNGITSFANRFQALETGMLVKRADLPKFSINNKVLNAYNRKNVIQSKMQYDPVTITFHDDAADVILNFWNDYYTYYFRDSDYNVSDYNYVDRYDLRKQIGWGFSPRDFSLPPFLSNIRIFSLHNKRFTEYLLINPIITSWRHGVHEAAANTTTMECTMTVEYETVKYFTGWINPVTVDGFSLLHYDNDPSPIATSKTNIYTSSGLLGVVDSAPKDLAKPDGIGGAGGLISNLLNVYKTYNNFKNTNLKNAVGLTLGSLAGGIINKSINTVTGSFAFPSGSSIGAGNGSSSVGQNNRSSIATQSNPTNQNAVTIQGASAATAIGSIVGANLFGNRIPAAVNGFTRGQQTSVLSDNNGSTPKTNNNFVFDVSPTNGVKVDPSTLTTQTRIAESFTTDAQGRPIPTKSRAGQLSGGYNPNDIEENVVSRTQVQDSEGKTLYVYSYQDGTVVKKDPATNTILSVSSGAANQININNRPVDAATAAASGAALPNTAVQYKTDPNTGIVYTVGNTATAQITNTITSGLGLATGLAAGTALNQKLTQGSLGKTLIGRTIAGATSAATGFAVGRAINNGLQPIVNPVTGYIVQGLDKATNNIQNIWNSWTGTGGFDKTRQNDNLVNTFVDADGTTVRVYKNGDTVYGMGNNITVVPGSKNTGIESFRDIQRGQNSDSYGSLPTTTTVLSDSSGNPIQTTTQSTAIDMNNLLNSASTYDDLSLPGATGYSYSPGPYDSDSEF